MLKVKHWSRTASIAFSLLFIAIMCFTLLPSPVQIGPLSFGGAGVARATDYTQVVFTGNDTWVVPSELVTLTVLVVAGGGGGGSGYTSKGSSGGGGAGGIIFWNGNYTVTPGATLTIVIGNGGPGSTVGGNSIVSGSGSTTLTAVGGGLGGAAWGGSGGNGGSGGGGAGNTGAAGGAGSGTTGQGYNGAAGISSIYNPVGGGGGGASHLGYVGQGDATHDIGGNGGEGTNYSTTFGSSVPVPNSGVFGGGGGGASWNGGTGGSGGTGGGGAGVNGNSNTGGAGTANTGGGGGGGGGTGGAGGSGVVIIKYASLSLTTTTLAATSITTTSATLNGNVTSLGIYGNVTSYGFVLSTSTQSNPGNVSPSAQTTYTAGNWTWTGVQYAVGQTFNSDGNVTGLSPDTCYYFRAAGYSTYGWVYGSEQSLLTEPSTLGLPTGYEYTVPLTVTNTSGSTLTNYPVRAPVRKGVNPIVTVSPKQSLNGGSYGYYIPMTVTEYSNTTLTNYQFKVDVNTAWLVTNGYSTVSGTCVRWTDNSNNLLNFWLETSGAAAGWNNADTYYWVMGNVTALGNTTIRMWFDPSTGNTTTASSMANTFPTFFDDFDDASIDGAKWTYTADATETGGQIQVGNATAGDIARTFTSISSPLAVNTRLRFSGYMSSTGTTSTRIGSVRGNSNTFFFNYNAFSANLWAEYYDISHYTDIGYQVSDANHVWEIDRAGSETHSGMTIFQIDLQSLYPLSTVVGTAPVYKNPIGHESTGSTQVGGWVNAVSKYTRMQWVFVSQYVSPEPVTTYLPFGDPQAIFLQEHSLSWPYDITFYRSDRETPIPFWRDPETQFVSSNDYCVDYWAQVPVIPTSNNATIWLAYGKGNEADQSNGETTFAYFNPGNETTSLTAGSGTWATETQQKPLFYSVWPHNTRAAALFSVGGEWIVFGGFNELEPAVSPAGTSNPWPYSPIVFRSPDLVTWSELPTVPFYLSDDWIHFHGPWSVSIGEKDGVYYIAISSDNLGFMGIVSTTDFVTYTPYTGNPVADFSGVGYDFSLFYDSATSQWITHYSANAGGISWGNSSSVYGPYTARTSLVAGGFREASCLVEVDSTYYLFYTYSGDGGVTGQLYYATCSSAPPWNASSFTEQGAVTLSQSEWDYSSLACPQVSWDATNSRWIMSWCGQSGLSLTGDYLMGWATSPDLTDGGTWTLQNTQTEIKQSDTAAAYKIATIGNYTNYAIAAEVNIKNPGAASQYAGFVMGYSNSTSFYGSLLHNSNNPATGTLLQQKYTGSPTTLSDTATVVPIIPGNRMRLEAKNVAGNMTINYSKWGVKWNPTVWNYDTTLTGQGVGLVTYGAGANYANIRIRPCVNPEPTLTVGGVEISTTPDISNTPSLWSVGVVQPSQTRWANGDGGNGIFGLNSGDDSWSTDSDLLEGQRFQNTLGTVQWTQKTAMTHAAADVPGCTYNGKLYVFGGYGTNNTDYLNYTQIYDPVADSWSQGTVMPTARWGAAATEYVGKIYVFGGRVSGAIATNKCEIYDVAGNSWATGTVLPVAQDNGIMAMTVGTKIYLFYYSYVYEFDPTGNGGAGSYTVKTAPPAASQKKWATCGYVSVGGEGRIYIIGGSTTVAYTDTNYYYIPSTDTWSSAQAVAPYAAHGTTRSNPVYNNKIYFGFGYNTGIDFYSGMYCYDPTTNKWAGSYPAALLGGRDGQANGFIGSKLYSVGGRNDPDGGSLHGLDWNESFDAATSTDILTQTELFFDDASPNGNVRLGIYDDIEGVPTNLLVDAGAVSVANGWVNKSGLTLPVNRNAYYWLAYNLSATNNVKFYTGYATASYAEVAATYGALPTIFTPGGFFSANPYVMRATVTTTEPDWPLSASDCWGNLTNNSSFAVNISASMTDMTGGTTWSIGSSPGTNVFTLKIGILGTANIGNFTTLSNIPVAWITNMAAGNMTRWTMVFYTPTNTPQFADGTPKSGTITFEAEPL